MEPTYCEECGAKLFWKGPYECGFDAVTGKKGQLFYLACPTYERIPRWKRMWRIDSHTPKHYMSLGYGAYQKVTYDANSKV